MHTHILGICGTFMAGVATLAKQMGYTVTGQDEAVYPPMSTQLETLGIEFSQGFEQLPSGGDLNSIVVGNVMSRGMPVIEELLEKKRPLLSGPQWLYQHVLQDKWVIAVSGTHGKTSTASMVAWILDQAGLNPGFLIGGIPQNFGVSARLGRGDFFVLEADEYDCAFFDKRSKFVHYRPKTLIINNLEFDHADIFDDLKAIQKQFHHLIRTMPRSGHIIYPSDDQNVLEVLKQGCWSCQKPIQKQTIRWDLLGEHNHNNGSAAIMAAEHVGVSREHALNALEKFKGVKRRLEIKVKKAGITVYDDFAHHPTAIKTTLAGLKQSLPSTERIVALIDVRSSTMRKGDHSMTLSGALHDADEVYFYHKVDLQWDLPAVFKAINKPGGVFQNAKDYLNTVMKAIKEGDHVVCMSNGGFDGVIEGIVRSVS